jgi:phage gpG-like protein
MSVVASIKSKRLDKKIQKNFEAASRGDKRFFTLMVAIAQRDVDQHFQNEMGPKKRWQKWSDAYALSRGTGRILQDTGALKGSVSPASFARPKSGKITLLTSGLAYSKTHDEGDKGRNIPKRKYMWISDEAIEKMADVALKYLQGGK